MSADLSVTDTGERVGAEEGLVTTLGACVRDGAGRLATAGISAPRHEARLLLEHVLRLRPGETIGWPEREVVDRAAFDAAIARRAAREPLSRIVGEREFWSLPFLVTPDTLDPRADSEAVVEAALVGLPDHRAARSVLDLGVGTGCLLLSMLTELPLAFGVGVDVSEAAVAVARRNAARLGLADRTAFVVGEWSDAVAGTFDVIVSNPPYLRRGELGTLEPEVAFHDPRLALDGGADGLDAYRAIAGGARRLCHPEGVVVVEFGAGQEGSVSALFHVAGLRLVAARRDLAGIVRAGVYRVQNP